MLRFDNVSYVYPGDLPDADGYLPYAVSSVSLSVSPGERVVLLGANGSGKSTLLGLAKGVLLPEEGTITVDGVDIRNNGTADVIGYVHQDSSGQFVSPLVYDEVVLGPRNMGLGVGEASARATSGLACVGLADYASRCIAELSGGERQLLALADILALEPKYLLLDCVDAQLDGSVRARVRSLLAALAAEGVGVLEVTHTFEEVVTADRAVVMAGGQVVWLGTPQQLLCSEEALQASGMAGDTGVRLVTLLARRDYDVSQGTDPRQLVSFAREKGLEGRFRRLLVDLLPRRTSVADVTYGKPLQLKYVTFDFASPEELMYRGAHHVLDDVSLTADPGTLTLVAGASGSGKSTAARMMAGLLDPDAGESTLGEDPVQPGRVGLCFQRSEDQLFCDTVAQDVGFGPWQMGVSAESVDQRVADALELLGLTEMGEQSPFALCAGDRRRAAIAGILALRPEAYIFDEPSADLDDEGRKALHSIIALLVNRGAPVVVVSSDVDEWLSHADQVVLLREGRVVYAGSSARLATNARPFQEAGIAAPLAVRVADLVAHPKEPSHA